MQGLQPPLKHERIMVAQVFNLCAPVENRCHQELFKDGGYLVAWVMFFLCFSLLVRLLEKIAGYLILKGKMLKIIQ
jgi:hypothetical protein